MTTKKMTKAQKFEMLLDLAEVQKNEMLVEFIEHELELLAKKNSAEKKPTAQQTANKAIAEAIVNTLAENPTRLFTITEIIKTVPACADLTNQRVSAIVRNLIDKDIERVEEKRKAYFRYLG